MTDSLTSHDFSLPHGHASSVTTSPLDYAGMASNSIKLLTGNSHPDLAKAVADRFVMVAVQGKSLDQNI